MNEEYRNDDFNIIPDNEALAIDLELSNNQNLTLPTIYCPDGNPNLSLFQAISNLSHLVLCSKILKKQLNLIYLSNDEHTHMDRANGSTDLLDMAFISPNLAKHDTQFQIRDGLRSDHLPIEVSIDAPPHRNSSINHTTYKFDQTDRKVFESTLEAALGSVDFSELTSTSDLDK